MADERREVAGERTRRLDSDAAAVQLVTIHGSKGLQYPVVYLPTLWDRFESDPKVPLWHSREPGDLGQRCRNVGGGGPGWADSIARHRSEDSGESLRLLYVAMTRAQSQVVAWYAPAKRNAPASPLHRMLLARRPGSPEVPDSQPLDDAATLVAKLDWHRDHGGPAWEPAVWTEPAEEPLPVDAAELAARTFNRAIDGTWRRTSYSSLSSAATTPAPQALSEPEEPPRDDEEVAGLETGAGAPSSSSDARPVAHGRASGRGDLRLPGPRRARARRS